MPRIREKIYVLRVVQHIKLSIQLLALCTRQLIVQAIVF